MNCLDTNIRILHRRRRHFRKNQKSGSEELHMYDVLRADRCISRKFSGSQSAIWRSGLCPVCDGNRSGEKAECVSERKYLLRHAFEKGDYLPEHILWREKAAFSDAVGHSMVDDLKEYADTCYTEEALKRNVKNILMHSRLQKSLFCIGRFLKNIIRDRRK
mgnify:CR=1 FL=1